MRKLLPLLFSVISLSALAQDEPVFSHYMFNSISFNPSYAGNKDNLQIQSNYRLQWIGLEGAPRTIQFSFDGPVYKKMSAGLDIVEDKIGNFSTTKIYSNYAYRISLNGNSRISFGLALGYENRRLNKGDGYIDPAYNSIDLSQNTFNARSGIYLSNNDFYIGISGTNLIENETYFNASKLKPQRNLYLTTGYLFKLSETTVFYPSVLYKDDFNNSSYFNFTGLIGYNSIIWAGISYRRGFELFSNNQSDFSNNTSQVLGLLVDFEINNQLRLGYNFDYSLSYLKNYESGSHELSVSYFFGSKKSKRMLNPRYL